VTGRSILVAPARFLHKAKCSKIDLHRNKGALAYSYFLNEPQALRGLSHKKGTAKENPGQSFAHLRLLIAQHPTMTVPKQGSKFNIRINPVYQVDWANEASGKRLAATKRRIRFRFGFSDAAAIQAGEKGPACRGEEHEVLLVWSLSSGKKLVTMDNKEVHFSCGGKLTQQKFETSWHMGCHTVKIIAHAAPPLVQTPGFRHVDLLIDGLSFFEFDKIYELGTKSNNKALVVRSGNNEAYNNYSLPPSHEHSFAHRADPSSTSVKKPTPAIIEPETVPVVDMLSSETNSPCSEQDFLDSGYNSEASPTSVMDEFTPHTAALEPPLFSMVSNQIMSAYAYAPAPASPPVLALPNESHTYGDYNQTTLVSPQSQTQYYEQPQQSYSHAPQTQQQQCYQQPHYQQQGYYQQQEQEQQSYYQQQNAPAPISQEQATSNPAPFAHPVTPSMEPLSIGDIEAREAPPVSTMEKAVRSLVNLDDICETLETPEQRKFQQQKTAKQPVQSKPLPPSQADWKLGLQPRLGDIKQNAAPKAAPAKEIMRTHAFDPAAGQAGMMVVYGAATTAAAQPGFGYHHHQQQQQQYQQHPHFGYSHQQHYQQQQQPRMYSYAS